VGLSSLLRRLDHAVLDRRYGTRWLVAVALVGFALAVFGIWGLVAGRGSGATGEPFAAGMVLFVLPLFEVWRRRRAAAGKRPPLDRLRRLDRRMLKRR
jgi:hypothetical protein